MGRQNYAGADMLHPYCASKSCCGGGEPTWERHTVVLLLVKKAHGLSADSPRRQLSLRCDKRLGRQSLQKL